MIWICRALVYLLIGAFWIGLKYGTSDISGKEGRGTMALFLWPFEMAETLGLMFHKFLS